MKWTNHPDLTYKSLVHSSQVQIAIVYVTVTEPYTFSVKPKWQTVVFWIFATHTSAVAYLHKSVPLEHSTVDIPGAWEVW